MPPPLAEQHVAAHEAEIQQQMSTQGRAFAGAKTIRQTPWTQTATSYEHKRRMNPKIAAKKIWHRLQAIVHCKAFLAAYRIAYRAWRGGDKTVSFPAGTYAMRIYANVCCAPI